MQLKDLDSYKYPSRRPWILIVIVALASVIIYRQTHKSEKPEIADSSPETVVEEIIAPEPVSEVKVSQADNKASLAEAKEHDSAAKEGDPRAYPKARAVYLDIVSRKNLDIRMREEAERKLGELHIEIITTPRQMPEKVEYVVKSGDSIEKIARKFGTTIDLIQLSNEIKNPNLIKAGDLYRVFKGKFSISISKSKNELLLMMNGEFFKRYKVGTGKYGKTPVGTFVLIEKEKEPVWWPKGREIPFGDPENILGTRWMTLKATGETPDIKGYGIHGTWLDDSIGKAESAGCIRMRNREVEELYMLVPSGTPVTIND